MQLAHPYLLVVPFSSPPSSPKGTENTSIIGVLTIPFLDTISSHNTIVDNFSIIPSNRRFLRNMNAQKWLKFIDNEYKMK